MILTEEENEQALRRIYELMDTDADDELDALVAEVEAFEAEHYPMDDTKEITMNNIYELERLLHKYGQKLAEGDYAFLCIVGGPMMELRTNYVGVLTYVNSIDAAVAWLKGAVGEA